MIWFFGFFLLGLHDDLDEGSQQRCETLMVLNMRREIVQHPDSINWVVSFARQSNYLPTTYSSRSQYVRKQSSTWYKSLRNSNIPFSSKKNKALAPRLREGRSVVMVLYVSRSTSPRSIDLLHPSSFPHSFQPLGHNVRMSHGCMQLLVRAQSNNSLFVLLVFFSGTVAIYCYQTRLNIMAHLISHYLYCTFAKYSKYNSFSHHQHNW